MNRFRTFLLTAVAVLGLLFLVPGLALAQTTGPTPTQQLIYNLIQVVIAAGGAVIATAWSKIFSFIQGFGVLGVLIAAALWGALAGFVSPILHVVIPGDINAVTGATISSILSAIAALVLHVEQQAVAMRRARLGVSFKF